jgi:hypothetical protein
MIINQGIIFIKILIKSFSNRTILTNVIIVNFPIQFLQSKSQNYIHLKN